MIVYTYIYSAYACMSACLYVYMCLLMDGWMDASMNGNVYLYMHMHLDMLCARLSSHICWAHACACVSMSVYACMCACMPLLMHIHVSIHSC